MHRHTNHSRRGGFTLIELIVVIGILLVLMALAVLIVPSLQQRQRAATGASMLQKWLNIAKTRALRDKAPRGIRLLPGKVNPNWVTEIQYIEQPEDFYGGQYRGVVGTTQSFIGVDFFNSNQANPQLWAVQPGDFLEVRGSGQVHRIIAVPSATALQLASAPFSTPITWQYRIIRAPRVAGEEVLSLPADVAIDISTNKMYGNPLSANADGSIDILFGPSGVLVGASAGTNNVFLWVRDTTLSTTPPYAGDQTILAIYSRTGFIAAHPVDVGSSDPYSFARDARSSGQ
jgi:prepilin-type N-terminal cleavage/methylation domain-containing protein